MPSSPLPALANMDRADRADRDDRRLRFTFVITRYGPDILGGGEKHARDICERLARRGHDVRVLTTCARSYTDWRDVMPAGREMIEGVEVLRFPVDRGRVRPLDEIVKAVGAVAPSLPGVGRAWSATMGPRVSALLDRLPAEAASRDVLVFFSLLSTFAFDGLPRVGARSVLVPLVHEEAPIYFSIARRTLSLPAALLVNTEEERARIERVSRGKSAPIAIVAVGREEPAARDPSFVPPTQRPYILVLGRAAKARPIVAAWRALQSLADAPPIELAEGRRVTWREIDLVTVGEPSQAFARAPNVVQLPFVDDATRWQLTRNAIAIVNPSRHESLSLVLIEAWSCGVPVVVNAACDVTAGQVRRSRGGVTVDFSDPVAAARAIATALISSADRASMGSSGEAYVAARYDWDRVLDCYERVARTLRSGGSLVDLCASS